MVPVSCVRLLIVLPWLSRENMKVVLTVLAFRVFTDNVLIYALPDERERVSKLFVLKIEADVDV